MPLVPSVVVVERGLRLWFGGSLYAEPELVGEMPL
jgi:hypothetical protein